jgi:hypothetical protein
MIVEADGLPPINVEIEHTPKGRVFVGKTMTGRPVLWGDWSSRADETDEQFRDRRMPVMLQRIRACLTAKT